jgi:predicted Zn-dependent protease with MMP-like domain
MLAPPRSLAGPRLRARRPTLPSEFFFECVSEAIKDVAQHCPEALAHVDIGVEEVPDVVDLWPQRVPLAMARDATLDRLAQVVLYRRPIEFRCSNRSQVRELVFTTVVEQLSQVTGIPVEQLDPDHLRGPD